MEFEPTTLCDLHVAGHFDTDLLIINSAKSSFAV